MKARLDRLDRQLLSCLQADNLQTADRLAEQVGRSPSAIARRLRRLRATGVVAADVAIISEEAAGHPLSAVVLIQLERHAPHEVAVVLRRLTASPNVQLCLNLAGAFDIMILVVAADMDAYNALAGRLLEQPGIRRFETTFVKSRVKATLAVPLTDQAGMPPPRN
jgi:Lrp/AsnC family leucine-responsive transcriptional regulator